MQLVVLVAARVVFTIVFVSSVVGWLFAEFQGKASNSRILGSFLPARLMIFYLLVQFYSY